MSSSWILGAAITVFVCRMRLLARYGMPRRWTGPGSLGDRSLNMLPVQICSPSAINRRLCGVPCSRTKVPFASNFPQLDHRMICPRTEIKSTAFENLLINPRLRLTHHLPCHNRQLIAIHHFEPYLHP
ncbi:hypothetical protein F5Y10DRAFT_241105 [Nemania abortiva]|nr:hypothetical protein F5Y10DRAFT_241105 [Nemania abortiva]